MAYIGARPVIEFSTLPSKDTFTGDGSTTAFDLANDVASGGENALEVFVNNVRQEPGSSKAFTLGADGSNALKRITFSAAPANGASIYVINDKTNTMTLLSPKDLNGVELFLDADADTTITADTDDRIDWKIAGVEHFSFSNSSGDTIIKPMVDAKDIIFQQYDGNKILDINDGNFVGIGGNATAPGEIRLYEDTDLGTNYVGFKSGNNTASVSYILPLADGTAGYQLSTDGSGTLSWSAAGTTFANDGNNRIVTGTGSATLNGEANLTFDGSALQVTGTVTTGVDGTGHDVKFFGDTAGSFLLWDQTDDALELTDSSPIKIGDGGDMTVYHDGSNSYITNATGALKIATETSGIALTIGHTTSETTVADNLTVTGTVGSGNITSSGTVQGTTITATTAFVADAQDGAALGTTSLQFSDLFLADGAVIGLGDNNEVTLTHVHDTGLLINTTMVIQFRDSAINIGSPADGDLDINADDEIELNSTLIDINGNVEISGTAVTTGVHTFTAVPVFPNNTVETADIQADAITNAKIADDAIDSEHYTDGSIDNAHIADDAIDSEHYAAASIDTAHIAADQIVASLIADDAIDSEHYTDGSIDNAHIADDAIDSEHYADGSIDNAHIADDAIDSEHYAAGSIDTAHIADNQITLAKLAGGTDGNVISYDASGDPVAIATGSDGQVLTSTGAGSPPAFEALPAGGTEWQAVKTGNFTASAGHGVFANTTSSAFTVTLPAGSIGDEVSIIDYAGTFDSNNLTVAANGSEKIHGSTDDLTVATERAAFTLVFTDSTQGWLLKDK